MKIGIFGGSFNPPHICHALVCHYALAVGGMDRVMMIPTGQHPFGKELAPFADRFQMCRLAVAVLGDRIEVSDMENRREGLSYTVDTIREISDEHPEDRLRLIVGSDILREAEEWKDFDEIRRIAPPLVIPRGNHEPGPRSFHFPDLSSTEIRNALLRGEDVSNALPAAVMQYIHEKDLYID